jgi:hypothetical protein
MPAYKQNLECQTLHGKYRAANSSTVQGFFFYVPTAIFANVQENLFEKYTMLFDETAVQ